MPAAERRLAEAASAVILACTIGAVTVGPAAARAAPGDLGFGPAAGPPRTQALAWASAARRAAPARRRRRQRQRRPGCRSYCRQAGGYGGGPPGRPQVVIPSQTVRASRDGVVRLRARCRLDRARCQGAVLLSAPSPGPASELGRSDLDLPGRGRRSTIVVALSPRGRRTLRRAGRIRGAFATADVRRRGVWTSGRLTLLASR